MRRMFRARLPQKDRTAIFTASHKSAKNCVPLSTLTYDVETEFGGKSGARHGYRHTAQARLAQTVERDGGEVCLA